MNKFETCLLVLFSEVSKHHLLPLFPYPFGQGHQSILLQAFSWQHWLRNAVSFPPQVDSQGHEATKKIWATRLNRSFISMLLTDRETEGTVFLTTKCTFLFHLDFTVFESRLSYCRYAGTCTIIRGAFVIVILADSHTALKL